VLAEVLQVYIISLKAIWWICLALSVLAIVLVPLENALELPTQLKPKYGFDYVEGSISGELNTSTTSKQQQ
jgi:hypothetical protein